MAIHENGRWLFNPEDTHPIKPGATLVMMASPGGRALIEKLVKT
jgi:voltage-gated potassium channel